MPRPTRPQRKSSQFRASAKLINPQTEKPNAINTETATKKIWNALSDILVSYLFFRRVNAVIVPIGAAGHLVPRPDRKIHEPSEEKNGSQENRIDGLALGHQVH